MTHDFAGRAVLLTGGLGSLGRAQARAFLAAGAHVILVDLPDHPERDAILADVMPGETGRLEFVGLDLGDLAAARAAVERLAGRPAGVDILVNNAALILNRPFESFSLEEYERQMRVNAGAAFALAQAVAPGMKARSDGVIVNFCSVTLSGEWEGYVPYVASKGAMLGLTRSLARELGPFGVRVNAVSPGAVVSDAETRVFGDRADEYAAWVLERQCLPRRIQPDDIASAVLFLCGAGAAMITGQCLHIDGGW